MEAQNALLLHWPLGDLLTVSFSSTPQPWVFSDTLISYECENAHILTAPWEKRKCSDNTGRGRTLTLSITSSKISPKQTCGVSSVTLCRLLITHSVSHTQAATQTQQVEASDNQNQAGTGEWDADEGAETIRRSAKWAMEAGRWWGANTEKQPLKSRKTSCRVVWYMSSGKEKCKCNMQMMEARRNKGKREWRKKEMVYGKGSNRMMQIKTKRPLLNLSMKYHKSTVFCFDYQTSHIQSSRFRLIRDAPIRSLFLARVRVQVFW